MENGNRDAPPVFLSVEDDHSLLFSQDCVRTKRNVSRQFVDSIGHATGSKEELLVVVEDRDESNLRVENFAAPRDDRAEDGMVLQRIGPRSFDTVVEY